MSRNITALIGNRIILLEKKWREAHPEEARELNRRTAASWRQRNREKYNAYQRAWRAKKKALAEKEKA